jgi:hypothetical protein
MNAAIPSTTNAMMMTQTSTIAAVIPVDIVVMSIILNYSLKWGPFGTSDSKAPREEAERPGI